jgi:hypothetical protein
MRTLDHTDARLAASSNLRRKSCTGSSVRCCWRWTRRTLIRGSRSAMFLTPTIVQISAQRLRVRFGHRDEKDVCRHRPTAINKRPNIHQPKIQACSFSPFLWPRLSEPQNGWLFPGSAAGGSSESFFHKSGRVNHWSTSGSPLP